MELDHDRDTRSFSWIPQDIPSSGGREKQTDIYFLVYKGGNRISPNERGPFSYVSGYVISKLYQTSRSRKGTCDETLHVLLQSLK